MSFETCAARVKSGDPDRYLSAQSAPEEDQKALMAIYAVNLELASAPWASPEPLVAQMRLRWWGDEIAKIYRGELVNSHEILPALREVVFDHNLPQPLFQAIVDARMADVYADPPETRAAFDRYIHDTSGSVMLLAARTLGTPEKALPLIADFAYGSGVANLLRAVPELTARGRTPLPHDVGDVVDDAIASLTRARSNRSALPRRTVPALLAGWRADATLSEARKRPDHIEAGLLEESPARKMMSFRRRRFLRLW